MRKYLFCGAKLTKELKFTDEAITFYSITILNWKFNN